MEMKEMYKELNDGWQGDALPLKRALDSLAQELDKIVRESRLESLTLEARRLSVEIEYKGLFFLMRENRYKGYDVDVWDGEEYVPVSSYYIFIGSGRCPDLERVAKKILTDFRKKLELGDRV